MIRVLRLAALALIVLVMSARPGEASIMDWMQELSGPGPFTGYSGAMTRICPLVLPAPTPGEAAERGLKDPCLFFDVRHLFTDEEHSRGRFGEVKVLAVEFGPNFRVWRALDIGFGGGIFHFNSHGQDGTRITLVVPRIELKPVLLFASASYWKEHPTGRKWASIPKYHVRNVIILGRLQDQDFGATPSPGSAPFNVRNDDVFSGGLLFDFSELVW
jgi:hypothetical protein